MFLALIAKVPQLLSPSIPFICLAGIVLLQSQEYKKSVHQLNTGDYLAREREEARLLDWQLRSPKLGFNNLMANWTYLNFVQYFGDSDARETIGYQLVPEYFTTIAQIDPHFTKAHLNLSVANSMYAGDPEQTIALMEEVLKSADPQEKNAPFLWTAKGLDELLFMGDKQAALESYKMAAKWSALAMNDSDRDLAIADLESALATVEPIDLKEAQIRAWSGVLVHIKDRHRRREIIAKIDNLKTEIIELKKLEANSDR